MEATVYVKKEAKTIMEHGRTFFSFSIKVACENESVYHVSGILAQDCETSNFGIFLLTDSDEWDDCFESVFECAVSCGETMPLLLADDVEQKIAAYIHENHPEDTSEETIMAFSQEQALTTVH